MPKRIVAPSGAARATISVPMTPVAPGLFFNYYRAPGELAKIGRDYTRADISGAACRKGHYEPHRWRDLSQGGRGTQCPEK